jgi:RNA exonuclease 1
VQVKLVGKDVSSKGSSSNEVSCQGSPKMFPFIPRSLSEILPLDNSIASSTSMGKNNKKRTYRDFADRPKTQERGYSVGDAMHEVKKRRLSSEPSEIIENSSMTTPEAMQSGVVGSKALEPVEDGGWQTVTHKSTRQNKRRDADGNRTKYPELVFHSKKQESIRIADLQQLILYAFADGVAPTWVALKNFGHTRKIVTLMVPGLEKEMFDGSSELFSSGETEHGDQPHTAESTNPPTSENRSDQVIDAEEQKRNGFNAWKQGQQIPKPTPNDASPININVLTLPPSLKSITDIFSQVWPVKAPGDSKYAKIHSPLQAMLIAPLPQRAQSKDNKSDYSHGSRGYEAVRTPVSQLVHSADDLREADYPIHPATFSSMEDSELERERRIASNQSAACGWVDSAVTTAVPTDRPDRGGLSLRQGFGVYAIDCEMVLTSDDVYSLARISIIDWSGKTVLDKYVKPTLPIKNYFTQYSGITPALLENVTTTLPDIQEDLLKLCTPSAILLGHSLESDLTALKFTHPFIIDTSLIYPHPRGPPLRSSLKYLTNKYLRREIQSGGADGHNSVEDALAVLDLVKLKCEKGPNFGTFEASGEPIFRALGRSRGGKDGKTSAIVDYGTPERGYGKEATHAIGCVDDGSVVAGIIRAVNGDPTGEEIKAGGVDFVWGRLRELESFRGWCNNNREYGTVDGLHANGTGTASEAKTDNASATKLDTKPDSAVAESNLTTDSGTQPNPPPPNTLELTLARTISHIKEIHSALPACTLFIVYSGTGDPREVGRLQKMQSQYRKEFKVKKWDDLTVKWTDTEEQMLKRAVDRARRGIGFMTVV